MHPRALESTWFRGGPDLDAEITSRFGGDLEALLSHEYDSWRSGDDPAETLAGIILGDQLARNMHRGTPKMYAADPIALLWAQGLVASGADKTSLKPFQRIWVYMPFMHSESLVDQERCVQLFTGMQAEAAALPGGEALAGMLAQNSKYAALHRDVVKQYGRFPHRNTILGRESTEAEIEGMRDGKIPNF